MTNYLEIILGAFWLEIIILLLFIVLAFILEQKFNFKKPRKWFFAFNKLIFNRGLSVLAYVIPYLEMVNYHIPILEEDNPLILKVFVPYFVADAIEVIQQIPFLTFIYIMLSYAFLIRRKVPKERLVRYNIMYGIMIISLQSTFIDMFISLNDTLVADDFVRSQLAVLAFFAWLCLYIPCFVRAILGKYDDNKFIREAVEVHLGRDGPDFIWWDRTRKDKAPKRPPLK